jgi:hypothetical protein
VTTDELLHQKRVDEALAVLNREPPTFEDMLLWVIGVATLASLGLWIAFPDARFGGFPAGPLFVALGFITAALTLVLKFLKRSGT